MRLSLHLTLIKLLSQSATAVLKLVLIPYPKNATQAPLKFNLLLGGRDANLRSALQIGNVYW